MCVCVCVCVNFVYLAGDKQRIRKSSACKVKGEKYHKNMTLLKNMVGRVRRVVRDEAEESK